MLKPSHLTAGFVAVLIGYTSSVAIVFQAAQTLGATPQEIGSWLFSLGIGLGALCLGLSWWFKTPILTAWSTPGAALLVTSASGLSLPEATGAFIVCAILIFVTGISGAFNRLMALIPPNLASAMLAGILVPFGLNMLTAFESDGLLVGILMAAYFLLKPFMPRWALLITLFGGMLVSFLLGRFNDGDLIWSISLPVFTLPSFNWLAAISVGLPLFIVTMGSQNIPGFAAITASGYKVNPSPLISWTGLTGLILAPFGGFAYNLAAITAAICLSDEADENKQTRYVGAMCAGVFYLIAGLFSATVVSLFFVLPNALIVTIAGLALLGTVGNSLAEALNNTPEHSREAALMTFLITASGMSFIGIGSAFWGLVVGVILNAWLTRNKQG